MRIFKWTGAAAAIILIIACFYPWVFIESKSLIIRGTDAVAIQLGKPAYFHFILLFLYLVFNFLPKVWAKRVNLIVVALNMGWALRNYYLISTCQGGECPVKQTAIYLLIPLSILVLLSALFPDMKMKNTVISNSIG